MFSLTDQPCLNERWYRRIKIVLQDIVISLTRCFLFFHVRQSKTLARPVKNAPQRLFFEEFCSAVLPRYVFPFLTIF